MVVQTCSCTQFQRQGGKLKPLCHGSSPGFCLDPTFFLALTQIYIEGLTLSPTFVSKLCTWSIP